MILVFNYTYIEMIMITSKQKERKKGIETLIRYSVNITLLHQPDIFFSNLRV